jgi:hypothetical protein
MDRLELGRLLATVEQTRGEFTQLKVSMSSSLCRTILLVRKLSGASEGWITTLLVLWISGTLPFLATYSYAAFAMRSAIVRDLEAFHKPFFVPLGDEVRADLRSKHRQFFRVSAECSTLPEESFFRVSAECSTLPEESSVLS